MSEIYFSCDIEADGPIPGMNSMLAFGAAAFTEGGEYIGMFEANLAELEGAIQDQDTMEWWKTQSKAWETIRKDVQSPAKAMGDFREWVEKIALEGSSGKDRRRGTPVFVGYPACYDFMWVYWYLRRFGFDSPFSHSGLDIKTMAMVLMNKPYRDSTKKNMPKRWFDKKLLHNHTPGVDAMSQGYLFCNMREEMLELRRVNP